MSNTLLANPGITKHLVEFFNVSFDPNNGLNDEQRNARREEIEVALVEELNKIPTLDADRYLRSLSKVIRAILRTNAYLGREAFAIKVAPQQIDFAPCPAPSSRFSSTPRASRVSTCASATSHEAVCAGPTAATTSAPRFWAWSGSDGEERCHHPHRRKGWFYLSSCPTPLWIATPGSPRAARVLQGLHPLPLDVTDNLEVGTDGSETSFAPEGVIARDENDYYLVVAADKGTAAFSDTANAISLERGFWLGDAFASGGSRRLRPQGNGHHRTRCLGVRQASLRRARLRRSDRRVHRRRYRRHVR